MFWSCEPDCVCLCTFSLVFYLLLNLKWCVCVCTLGPPSVVKVEVLKRGWSLEPFCQTQTWSSLVCWLACLQMLASLLLAFLLAGSCKIEKQIITCDKRGTLRGEWAKEVNFKWRKLCVEKEEEEALEERERAAVRIVLQSHVVGRIRSWQFLAAAFFFSSFSSLFFYFTKKLFYFLILFHSFCTFLRLNFCTFFLHQRQTFLQFGLSSSNNNNGSSGGWSIDQKGTLRR